MNSKALGVAVIAAVIIAIVASTAGGLTIAGVIRPNLATPLGTVRAYQIPCATTAGGTALVATGTQPVSSMRVWNNSTTPVYIGGTDIDSTHGMPICTDPASCVDDDQPMDARTAKCLSSSGTVTVTVLAGAL